MSAPSQIVRPDALDYLAGLSMNPADLPPEPSWTPIQATARRIARVHGIGPADTDPAVAASRMPRPTESVIAGLAGEQIQFVFQVIGEADGAHFRIGTWEQEGDPVDRHQATIESLIDGAYRAVDLRREPAGVDLSAMTHAAIVHGLPGASTGLSEAPWDRLLRSLHGCAYAVVVLAEPVGRAALTQLRDVALEDLRTAHAAQNARTDLPLTRAYGEQVETLVENLNRALMNGGWRTGVYLLGDDKSFRRLTAAWQGVFAWE